MKKGQKRRPAFAIGGVPMEPEFHFSKADHQEIEDTLRGDPGVSKFISNAEMYVTLHLTQKKSRAHIASEVSVRHNIKKVKKAATRLLERLESIKDDTRTTMQFGVGFYYLDELEAEVTLAKLGEATEGVRRLTKAAQLALENLDTPRMGRPGRDYSFLLDLIARDFETLIERRASESETSRFHAVASVIARAAGVPTSYLRDAIRTVRKQIDD